MVLAASLALATGARAQGEPGSRPAGPVIDLPAGPASGQTSAPPEAAPSESTWLGGYGELIFNDYENGDNQINVERFVVFLAHRFDERISLYSEVEVEDADEIEMEQAHLDVDLSDAVRVVAGLVLVPVGALNLHHEPPLFAGVERPRVDQVIIPTTWSEAGLGVAVRPVEGVEVDAYALSALDARGFSPDEGIRGGRQGVSEGLANNVAGAVRVTVEPVLGLALAASGYYGGAEQSGARGDAVHVGIAEADAVYRNFGVEARAELALVFIDGAAQLLDSDPPVANRLLGYYVELGFDVLEPLGTRQELVPFARFEAFDTQGDIAAGRTGDPALDRTDVTVGLSYRPLPAIVAKLDYQFTSAAEGEVPDQWDLGLGWMF